MSDIFAIKSASKLLKIMLNFTPTRSMSVIFAIKFASKMLKAEILRTSEPCKPKASKPTKSRKPSKPIKQ